MLRNQPLWRYMIRPGFWRFMWNYAHTLNRRAEVEEQLMKFARGKRPPFTPEECRDMANKLGNPTYGK